MNARQLSIPASATQQKSGPRTLPPMTRGTRQVPLRSQSSVDPRDSYSSSLNTCIIHPLILNRYIYPTHRSLESSRLQCSRLDPTQGRSNNSCRPSCLSLLDIRLVAQTASHFSKIGRSSSP